MKTQRLTLGDTPDDQIWCSVCLADLKRDAVWLSDDTRDGRHYCYHCAPDDAIRAEDCI